MINQERLINEFMNLVKISSETGYEREISDYLKRKFKDLELEVIEDNSQSITNYGSGNLIINWHGDEKEDIFYLTSHMDTVVPGKNIQPLIEGEYIVSNGTTILGSDDKAGIAAILEGIQVIKENNLPHGTVQFLITVGEESGLVGSHHLQKELIHAKYGYCLDSNGPVGNIIIAAPSQAKIRIIIEGKTAHAGVNPEDGINAIEVASKAISQIKWGRIDFETTSNIGIIKGGTATNIVTEKVEILAEVRSRNSDKLQEQINIIRETFSKITNNMLAKLDFHYEIMYPSFSFNEDDQLIKKAKFALQSIGREPKLLASGGGSDANVMNGYGIPTINLAVGYEKIHTVHERIKINELVKAAELVISLIKN